MTGRKRPHRPPLDGKWERSRQKGRARRAWPALLLPAPRVRTVAAQARVVAPPLWQGSSPLLRTCGSPERGTHHAGVGVPQGRVLQLLEPEAQQRLERERGAPGSLCCHCQLLSVRSKSAQHMRRPPWPSPNRPLAAAAELHRSQAHCLPSSSKLLGQTKSDMHWEKQLMTWVEIVLQIAPLRVAIKYQLR